jgi:hypothetical protein
MVELKLLNPTGVLEVLQPHAPRLEALDGRVIGELSNGTWDDERIFPFIRAQLQARFPRAKMVPFTEFPVGSEQIDCEAAIDLLQQKGCEAVITGNAA